MDGCLDDNEASEFASGSLAGMSATRVERHLATCRDCRSLVAALAPAPGDPDADSDVVTAPRRAALGKRGHKVVGAAAIASTQVGPGSAPTTEPQPGRARRRDPVIAAGDTVGRYVILAKLGAGGMGVVYTAYDPQLDRKVALKLLRTGGGVEEDEARARLIREAQAMSQLSHPNVVAVYDVGTAASGEVYIAMELVEGETLTAWLGNWERTWRDILGVFFQAGRGLADAHARGLVHRDFKPDNVLVGVDGRVRVTDFGLARSLIDQVDELVRDTPRPDLEALRVTLTATGTVLGTPRYMAPEQLRGADADARSDQYSFCVALYEALYHRHPIPGDSVFETVQHGAEPAAPPSDTKVPPAIGRAIMRGLHVDPGKRFPSLAALLLELTPPPAQARRRGWVVGLGAVALAAGGAAAAVVAQQSMADEASLPYEALRSAIDAARDEVQEIKEEMDRIVTGPGGLQEKEQIVRELQHELDETVKKVNELEQKIGTIRPAPPPPPRRLDPPPVPRPPTGLDDAAVLAGVAGKRVAIESCMEEWLERNPGRGATLLVRFEVLPDGSVRTRGARGMDDAHTPVCVERAVGRAQFAGAQAITEGEVTVIVEAGEIRVSSRRTGTARPPQTIDLGGTPAYPSP